VTIGAAGFGWAITLWVDLAFLAEILGAEDFFARILCFFTFALTLCFLGEVSLHAAPAYPRGRAVQRARHNNLAAIFIRESWFGPVRSDRVPAT
jgi:hypothetical protein